LSLKRALARLLLFGVLEVGALVGVPITPEQIEKLLDLMNRTRVVQVVKKDRDGELQ
jgi:hypothetical protein